MSEWQRRSLRDLTESVPAVSPAGQPGVPCTYIDISAVDNENHVIASPRTVLGRDAPRRARQPVREGDVLFANVRTYLRNVAQVPEVPQPAVASTGFTLLRARPGTSARFLFHLVRSRHFLSLVAGSESGTHYPATSAARVRSVEVLVPPLATQAAVASSLDRVQEAGRRVLAELAGAQADIGGAVRAATLMAIDGTLTESWREARRRPVASAYPAVRLKDCAEWIRYGTSQRGQPDRTGIPVLRMGNIRDGEVDWSDLRYLPQAGVAASLLLADGDVLFNRTNSPELVGKTAVFRGTRPATYASYLICIRVRPGVLHPDWLSAWLNSPPGRQWAASARTAGASQANISGAKLAGLGLPLPPYEEQAEIVRRLRLIAGAARAALARVEAAARETRSTLETLLDRAVSGQGNTVHPPAAGQEGRRNVGTGG